MPANQCGSRATPDDTKEGGAAQNVGPPNQAPVCSYVIEYSRNSKFRGPTKVPPKYGTSYFVYVGLLLGLDSN